MDSLEVTFWVLSGLIGSLLVLWWFFGGSLEVLSWFFVGSLRVLCDSVEFLDSFGRVFTLGFLVFFLLKVAYEIQILKGLKTGNFLIALTLLLRVITIRRNLQQLVLYSPNIATPTLQIFTP